MEKKINQNRWSVSNLSSNCLMKYNEDRKKWLMCKQKCEKDYLKINIQKTNTILNKTTSAEDMKIDGTSLRAVE